MKPGTQSTAAPATFATSTQPVAKPRVQPTRRDYVLTRGQHGRVEDDGTFRRYDAMDSERNRISLSREEAARLGPDRVVPAHQYRAATAPAGTAETSSPEEWAEVLSAMDEGNAVETVGNIDSMEDVTAAREAEEAGKKRPSVLAALDETEARIKAGKA